jgi:two-component system, cell cycle response regulator
MRYKVLTVDDSKTVRIIVRKAFKNYDCDILEAGNGIEGLAVAAKESPDLILLDITMPVMDGVEMLTKLKSDPKLKAIPVIMLTAEGGRDNVLKIAKIGVRDYLVKPFKEEALIEKAGRVIDLKPAADQAGAKIKSLFDSAEILVVEDKPAIVLQIQQGLKHMPWKIHGVSTQNEATDFCNRTTPDLVLASLSLPDEAAFNLFRAMRATAKTKLTPIFAIAVKTETGQQQQAQSLGFSAIITKPIDPVELEAKICKAMNLDTSQRYFGLDSGFLIMRLPENCSQSAITEAGNYLKIKVSEAVDAGHARMIIDIHGLKMLDVNVIKLLLQAMQMCRELTLQFAVVGNPQVAAECKAFEDTRNWVLHGTIDEAKRILGQASSASPQLATA